MNTNDVESNYYIAYLKYYWKLNVTGYEIMNNDIKLDNPTAQKNVYLKILFFFNEISFTV